MIHFSVIPSVVQLHALVEYETVEAAEKAVSVNLTLSFYAIMVFYVAGCAAFKV